MGQCSVMPKLLILHDSLDFGGHERMLLALLPEVLDDWRFSEVVFVLSDGNARLRAALTPLAPRLGIRTWAFSKRRAEPYLRHVRYAFRRAVRMLIRSEQPDVVLLVQGRIENLATALSVLPSNLPVVSYLPMAHSLAEMGRSKVGDRFRVPLYRRPDRFIVPARAVAGQVHRAGGVAPVSVVANVVPAAAPITQAEARARLDLPAAARVALLMGRLDEQQKGIDLFRGAVCRAGPGLLDRWTFLVVGDGPARATLEHLPNVRLIPWTAEPELYLAAADLLLMPSRWEGLPLVLLEAITAGLPVLASELDVFREYLEPEALVDFRSVELDAAMDRVMAAHKSARSGAPATKPDAHEQLAASRRAFADALAAVLP